MTTILAIGGAVVLVLWVMENRIERLSEQISELRERLDATQTDVGMLKSDVEDSQGALSKDDALSSLRSSGDSPRY